MSQGTKNRSRKGEGSIYFSEKINAWRGDIKWTDRNGVVHRKGFSGKKKTEVRARMAEFKAQVLLSEGRFNADETLFREFCDYWMSEVLIHKLKPTSYDRRKITLEHQVYPYLGDIPINDIKHADIQDMISKLSQSGLSYSTIKKAYEAVNGCLREYRVRSGNSSNPCEGISLPTTLQRETSDIFFFNSAQRELIAEECIRKYPNGTLVYRLGCAIGILLYTGMRIGELLALTWGDIDFNHNTIRINKNCVVIRENKNGQTKYKILDQSSAKTKSGMRVIPMGNVVKKYLLIALDLNEDFKYVISTQSGKHPFPRNISRTFYGILRATGISTEETGVYGLHSLRHTFASMLFQNGCDVKVVSELLGHSDTKITENTYIHLIQQQKVKAIQDIDKYCT